MPLAIRSNIADIFNGLNRSYIYIWLSKSAKAVYVGQTNDRTGSLGRGHRHFDINGQLRSRMYEKLDVIPEQFNDFVLISYLLPATQEFIGPETSYREAVEYLVQIQLHENRDRVVPFFRVISWVRSNDRTRDKTVQKLAQAIVDDFLTAY